MNQRWRRRLLIIGLIMLLCGALALVTTRSGDGPKPSYDQFITQVGAGQVAAVTMAPKEQTITVRTTSGQIYRIGYPEADAERMLARLRQAEVALEVVPITGASWWANLLAALLPLALILVLFGFLAVQMQGGGQKVLGFGRAGAREIDVDEAPTVTFSDVAGAAEAVEELREIRDFLASPDKFRALGARIPRGVLLSGPPGTGKTLLARAVAGEAGTPFYSISGSDFVEMFVGVGASRVRDLFARARQNGPCIIFIDEIDAVGRQRGSGMGGGHDEREQTLNQLLVEMDGFDSHNATIVIAATNRPDILDPALLRPGRFDRRVVVDRPDRSGRAEILRVHARGKPLGPDVDIERLAAQTPGLVGADLANLINEAALLAARRGARRILMADLEEAIMRTVAGPEKRSRLLSREERETTAFHEMGHALVGHFLADADPVHKISIVSRGQALGYTISAPDSDISLMRRAQLGDRMAMILGGRVAEQLVFGELTSGAANDLERVTEIAHQMVTRLGMSEAIGPRVVGASSGFNWWDHQGAAASSEGLAELIDREIGRLVHEAEGRARVVLVDHRELLDRLAGILLDQETINRDQFLRLIAGEDQRVVFGLTIPVAGEAERA